MESNQKNAELAYSICQEISIVADLEEAHWADGAHQGVSEIEKRVVIKNGSQPIAACQVVLEEMAYQFRDEWIHPPSGYEQKALRWVQRCDSQDGPIEIAANGSAKLALVKMFRFPNPYFGITYGDGSMGRTHHLTGTYRLRLRLEGKISNGSDKQDFSPCSFEVHLIYVSALELNIEDIVRINA